MSASYPAPAFPTSAMRSSASTRIAARSSCSRPARCRSTSRGWPSSSPPTSRRGRLAFTDELRRRGRRRRCRLHRRRHAVAPRRRPCRPVLCLRRRRGDRPRAGRRPTVIVTKSTVPVGTGDEVERILARRRAEHRRLAVVSNPEFLREGAAINDFKRPDRVVVGTDDEERAPGDARRLPAALAQPGLAGPVHLAAHGRAHQIRRQRLPGDEDHLHQRDRRSVRDGRRRRAAGGARHRPGQPHRREVPACRPGLWRLLLSRRTRWRW